MANRILASKSLQTAAVEAVLNGITLLLMRLCFLTVADVIGPAKEEEVSRFVDLASLSGGGVGVIV